MPKIVDHDAQRRAIIEKAVQLFVEQGYSGLGMRELAQALAMSKSALYHYFPSKEAVFAAVAESVIAADIASFDAQAQADAPFADKLHGLIDFLAANEAWYAQQFHILLEYARVRDEAEGAAQMRPAAEKYISALADYLHISMADGWALYLQYSGVILQRILDDGQTDLHDAMRGLVELLVAKYGTAQS